MDAYAQSRVNDVVGLGWLSRFGWLRTAELGQLMWPTSGHPRHQADRLARRWVERKLVLERELPEGAGRALVLATGGVRLLIDAGAGATSGKDIGEMVTGRWRAPLTWRHQLLAAGVLAELHRQGWTVYPELEIKRRAGLLVKIPDGLAVLADQVAWVEVERAHKTGPQGRQLVDALCAVGTGEAVSVLEHRPTVALVAYQADARDSRGNALDHRGRIRAAVAATSKKPVRVVWARCHLRGPAGLGAMELTQDTIQPDKAARILSRLTWREDPQEKGVLAARYENHLVRVFEDPEVKGWWGYQVDDGGGDRAPTKTDAKRRCAEALAGL